MTVQFEVNQSLVPVVPGQAGGTYKPKKLVAYRMCKGPPTGGTFCVHQPSAVSGGGVLVVVVVV